jgi:hypothetical protein
MLLDKLLWEEGEAGDSESGEEEVFAELFLGVYIK